MFRSLLASAFILASSISAAALDSGYWVVVGVEPQNEINPALQDKIRTRIARCGMEAFNDFSFKFSGFAPGYTVYVLGAYASKTEAAAVLAVAKKCVPDAYIKRGTYAGE